LVRLSCRPSPAISPSNSRIVGNHQPPFQVYLLHSWRFGANEVARSVIPNETNALASRVLQATAQYSICDWDSVLIPFTHYVLVTSRILKALEASAGRLRFEEGSGGVS